MRFLSLFPPSPRAPGKVISLWPAPLLRRTTSPSSRHLCRATSAASSRHVSYSPSHFQVVRHLVGAGHDVHVVTGAPNFVFTTEIQSSNLHIRKVLLDCGAVQADALTVDRLASLEKYHQTAVLPRASILATEVEWLNSIKADLVVSGVVPVACRAAADAGIRSVCVTNFSWDFIYSEYVVVAGHHHRSVLWQIAEDYSHCEFLLRLPGYCPMPAFQDVIDVPLVVKRLHKSRAEVRKELGISEDVKVLNFNFGGQALEDAFNSMEGVLCQKAEGVRIIYQLEGSLFAKMKECENLSA